MNQVNRLYLNQIYTHKEIIIMILVVGATGELGGMITHELLTQGKSVRALVRPGSESQSLTIAGAQTVTGDLKDRSSLDSACQGISTVISTANSARRGGDDNPETVEKLGNINLIEAAKSAGVNQFIFVSALVADANSPVPFIAGKAQAEQYLMASGMRYTIIAPTAFMEIWVGMLIASPIMASQTVTLAGSGERKHSFISVNDVAKFTIAAVDNPAAYNRRLVIGGPQPLSFRDTVSEFERLLGKKIKIQTVAPGDPIPGLPEAVWGIAASFDFYDSPVEMTKLTQEFDITPTSLEQVIHNMLNGN
jgi:uncharacterized protein YbjT (DUF2867 family)